MDFLFRPVNSASLGAYRILFGLLNFIGLARFWYLGWIERCFTGPGFLFKYWGFEWVKLWPGEGIYIHFAVMLVVCLLFSLGLFTRVMSVLLFLGFTYIELLDLSNYLNHYYFLSLMCFINIFLPLNARWSLDNQLGLSVRREFVPAWSLYWLRGQVGTVYFFAGIAKLGTDWLLHAQPLNIWLTASTAMPLIGPWLGEHWVQYLMSWSGFLFDLTIPFWMLNARARPYAYLAIVFFHTMTYLLFMIGMFPFIMVFSALVFFSPEWPLKAWGWLKGEKVLWPTPHFNFEFRAPVAAALVFYFLIQWTLPWRHLLYPGDVLWNEEGMRFSWKVMIREKNGDIGFRVVDKSTGRSWDVSPSQYIARHQEAEMSGTPDMILQFAHFLRDEFKKDGLDVAVYADTWTSFNGRAPTRLIDPQVDLGQMNDDLRPKAWIMPAPSSSPRTLSHLASKGP